jgi:hypothetical protein
MGLDMYLTRRIYIGAEYEHRNVKAKIDITIDGKPVKVDVKKLNSINERVGYWRKANAIHQWFVENCQKGIDECQEVYVGREKLQELLDLCKKAKKDKKVAKDELPTQEGFFFGSTEYGECYMQDLDYTIKLLKGLLADKDDHSDFYYLASW